MYPLGLLKQACIGKVKKKRCDNKAIKMAVIPNGLTFYLPNSDMGIFKSFKDHMSVLIDQ
ncbi:Pogo transposable element with KRAB domainlike [Phytophthora palmivora]|uniref:Pogo transposable element with KRAB domainlike n=1 Tax=Phytophthora palmivora TaxID=4796 RepID=A0A2P4XND9_9STRA|nr:Pogo transposable element with KRAB domainlike [Phytophthora palmivora]